MIEEGFRVALLGIVQRPHALHTPGVTVPLMEAELRLPTMEDLLLFEQLSPWDPIANAAT